jgi:outer membrane lipoprotein-sorting protein
MKSLVMLAVCLLATLGAKAEELDATEIIRRSDELLRRTESYTHLRMEIVRPDWSRTVELEAWTRGASNSFIRVLSPKKERGVTFLKIGREAWQYVPAIDRTIKIPPSMMLQSWMGSDFTNDDVVRADSLIVDYTHRIVESPERDGVACWIIEAIPKPDAPVVWGKILFQIRQDNYIALRADYYDEAGEVVKYYETSDVQTIEGLELATRFVMHDLERPGYHTRIQYSGLTFSPDIEPDRFSVRRLKR